MKKSHRKEVIIARIIFAAILLVLIGLIILAASFISKKLKDKDKDESQTKIESQVKDDSEETKDSQEKPDSQNSQSPSTHTPGTQMPGTESSESATPEPSESEEIPSEEPEAPQTTPGAWVTVTNVKFRTEPNTTCEVIVGINGGTEVTVISTENGWTKVSYQGYTGYIRADLLKQN